MAKILYGINGEGMGHALRSTAIIEHLIKKHEIVIITSGRAYEYLKKVFEKVYKIHGFHIEYEDNKVKTFASFIDNTAKLPEGILTSIKSINKIINEFNPDICITDFEPFSCNTAKKRNIPCLAVDNINVITKTKIDFDKKYLSDFLISQAVCNFMTPDADYYLLTTFFFPEVKTKKTILFPPIIRKKILETKKLYPNVKPKHVLVYQTSKSNHYLIELLKNVKEKFIIYGFEKNQKEENLIFKSFSIDKFCEDFAFAKGIITNGGYSLISEAIFLEKPILSEPVKKQFEQIMNALYIEKIGFGLYSEKISFADIIKFLSNLSEYKKHLKKINFDNNKRLFKKLDELININK